MPVAIGSDDSLRYFSYSSATSKLVVRAATAAQKEAALQYALDTWKDIAPLSVVRQRWEHQLANPLFAAAEHLVLVPRHDPNTLDIRARTKIYKVPILLSRAGSDHIEQSTAYWVDGALVPPKHRGNSCASYASSEGDALSPSRDATLMAMLVTKAVGQSFAANRDSPWLLFGISEAPPKIWTGAGVQTFPSCEAHVATSAYPYIAETGAAVLLDAEGVYSLVGRDVENLKQKLLSRPQDCTRFALLPSRDLYSSIYDDHIAVLSFRLGEDMPRMFGAEVGEAYTFWKHDLAGSTLYLLRFVAFDDASARQLMQAAANEASQWGLEHIVCWDMDRQSAERLNCTFRNRPAEVPMAYACDTQIKLDWVDTARYCFVME